MLQADATLTAEILRENSNSYKWLEDPILIAHHRADWTAERKALTPYMAYPLDAAGYAPEYVESGSLEDLRGLLQNLVKREDKIGIYWVHGIIELAEGRIARSIENLRKAQEANEPGGYRGADQLPPRWSTLDASRKPWRHYASARPNSRASQTPKPCSGSTSMVAGTSHGYTGKPAIWQKLRSWRVLSAPN